jgi:GMP synthase-like glutamine amidotransferase
VYGFQFHMEVSKGMIAEWFRDTPDLDAMKKETEQIYEEYAGRAKNFYRYFFLKE